MPSTAATVRQTTSVVLDAEQSAALAAFMKDNPGVRFRAQGIILLMQRGLDGVQIRSDLRERLERYRASQEFPPTLEQVVDKLLREGLDAALPQRELNLDPPRRAKPPTGTSRPQS